jgi:hypothetical protein
MSIKRFHSVPIGEFLRGIFFLANNKIGVFSAGFKKIADLKRIAQCQAPAK